MGKKNDIEFGTGLIQKYIEALENDKIFITFPEEFLKNLCSQFDNCKKIYQTEDVKI